MHAQSFHRIQRFVTPWITVFQAPLSIGSPRQEHWSGCRFLLQGISPTQGDTWDTWTSRVSCIGRWFFTTAPPGKPRQRLSHEMLRQIWITILSEKKKKLMLLLNASIHRKSKGSFLLHTFELLYLQGYKTTAGIISPPMWYLSLQLKSVGLIYKQM